MDRHVSITSYECPAGQSCHAAEPGFFRICYAIVSHETILHLVQRLSDFLCKSESERQAVALWISRDSLNKTADETRDGLAEPEATALQ